MTSQAVRDFCTASRSGELLRARRRQEKRQALEARKAAEQLLIETLGEDARYRVLVDEAPYVVAVKRREVFPSFTSCVVDRLYALWDDVDSLRRRLEGVDAPDVITAVEAVILEEAGGAPRCSLALQLVPLKANPDKELEELPSSCADLAAALVHAKEELGQGKEEHAEESKRLLQQKQEAEVSLIQELSALERGQVKRVNMLEADGSSASFYLRLKKPRPPPKKKITRKTLKSHIHSTLEGDLDLMNIGSAMARVCEPAFGESFLAELKTRLQDHETVEPPPGGAGGEPARVALDRIRLPKRATPTP